MAVSKWPTNQTRWSSDDTAIVSPHQSLTQSSPWGAVVFVSSHPKSSMRSSNSRIWGGVGVWVLSVGQHKVPCSVWFWQNWVKFCITDRLMKSFNKFSSSSLVCCHSFHSNFPILVLALESKAVLSTDNVVQKVQISMHRSVMGLSCNRYTARI